MTYISLHGDSVTRFMSYIQWDSPIRLDENNFPMVLPWCWKDEGLKAPTSILYEFEAKV